MYKLCVLMFNIVQRSAPSYLVESCNTCSDDRLRSALCGDFVVPRTNTELANKAFCVAGRFAWNSLPSHIRTVDSKNTFYKQKNSSE